MKKIAMGLAVWVLAGSVWALEVKIGKIGEAPKKSTAQAEFAVEGWHCEACPQATADALKELKGVSKVGVDFKKGVCQVAYDPSKVKPDQLAKAIEGSGYKATLQEPKAPAKKKAGNKEPQTKQAE